MASNAKALKDLHPDVAGLVRPGRGQAVLCLHGFTATPHTFTELADRLSQQLGFHIHAPLLPGHGTLCTDLDTVSYKDWIHCAENSLQQLKRKFSNVHVVGLSMGGALAQLLNQQYPNELKSVSLLAPALDFLGELASPKVKAAHVLPKPILRRWILHKKQPTPGSIAYMSSSMAALRELFRLTDHLKQTLKRTQNPMLIQVCQGDPVVDPRSAHTIAAYNPQAKLIEYKNDAHILLLGPQKQEVINQIIAFISQHC
jgi:carboxylesterase